MASGSTRHIEPLLQQPAAAAASDPSWSYIQPRRPRWFRRHGRGATWQAKIAEGTITAPVIFTMTRPARHLPFIRPSRGRTWQAVIQQGTQVTPFIQTEFRVRPDRRRITRGRRGATWIVVVPQPPVVPPQVRPDRRRSTRGHRGATWQAKIQEGTITAPFIQTEFDKRPRRPSVAVRRGRTWQPVPPLTPVVVPPIQRRRLFPLRSRRGASWTVPPEVQQAVTDYLTYEWTKPQRRSNVLRRRGRDWEAPISEGAQAVAPYLTYEWTRPSRRPKVFWRRGDTWQAVIREGTITAPVIPPNVRPRRPSVLSRRGRSWQANIQQGTITSPVIPPITSPRRRPVFWRRGKTWQSKIAEGTITAPVIPPFRSPRRRPTLWRRGKTWQAKIQEGTVTTPPEGTEFEWQNRWQHRPPARQSRGRSWQGVIREGTITSPIIPPYTTSRRRRIVTRRGNIWTVPPEIQQIANTYWIQSARQNRPFWRRGTRWDAPVEAGAVVVPAYLTYEWMKPRRRGGAVPRTRNVRIWMVTPPEGQQTTVGFIGERDAIRIIPLISDDGGLTWRPRGTT